MTIQPNNRAEEIDELALRFIRERPEVEQRFQQITLEQIAKGQQRQSPSYVAAMLRYESPLGGDSATGWKINNDYLPLLVRRFREKYPQHAGFYKPRRRVSETRPPLKLAPLTPDFF